MKSNICTAVFFLLVLICSAQDNYHRIEIIPSVRSTYQMTTFNNESPTDYAMNQRKFGLGLDFGVFAYINQNWGIYTRATFSSSLRTNKSYLANNLQTVYGDSYYVQNVGKESNESIDLGMFFLGANYRKSVNRWMFNGQAGIGLSSILSGFYLSYRLKENGSNNYLSKQIRGFDNKGYLCLELGVGVSYQLSKRLHLLMGAQYAFLPKKIDYQEFSTNDVTGDQFHENKNLGKYYQLLSMNLGLKISVGQLIYH